jgi:uncharacterized protein (DUF1697 family)
LVGPEEAVVTTFVVLLRAVNVGGRSVRMHDVRAALGNVGAGEVATHLQSGNVLMSSRERSPAAVEQTVADALARAFDPPIEVIARTAAQLDAVTRRNPFSTRVRDPKAVHVGFLKSQPSAAARTALAGRSFGDDEFVLDGSELFLHYPDGSGRSKMTAAVFERVLGMPITARNWNVTTTLARLAAEFTG